MKNSTECDGAVVQASVSFFYLLTGVFLIAFVEKLVPDIVLSLQLEIEYDYIA